MLCDVDRPRPLVSWRTATGCAAEEGVRAAVGGGGGVRGWSERRSFSGFRTTQMCLIRSPATSNANTVTVTPSSPADQPGWPLTVCSRNATRPGVARLAISIQARAICSAPSMGLHEGNGESAAVGDRGSLGVEQADDGLDVLGAQAALKAMDDPWGWRSAGVTGARPVPADAAAGRRPELAAGGRGAADDLGHLGEGVAEDVVQDQRDALGRGHRLEHDQEGHADRLVEGDPIGRVDGAAPPGRPLIRSPGSGSGSGIHSPT